MPSTFTIKTSLFFILLPLFFQPLTLANVITPPADPDWRTVPRCQPTTYTGVECGGVDSQTFCNYKNSGVDVHFDFGTMWDVDAPNIYMATGGANGCDDNEHCAVEYEGTMRWTNDTLNNGTITTATMTFDPPSYIQDFTIGCCVQYLDTNSYR